MKNINFMQQNALDFATEKCVISENIKDEQNQEIVWELKRLNFVEFEELLKLSLSSRNKINYPKSIYKLIAKSVVKPNLNSVSLQNKYDVTSGEMLLRVMLTEDEYSKLFEKIKSMYIN